MVLVGEAHWRPAGGRRCVCSGDDLPLEDASGDVDEGAPSSLEVGREESEGGSEQVPNNASRTHTDALDVTACGKMAPC